MPLPPLLASTWRSFCWASATEGRAKRRLRGHIGPHLQAHHAVELCAAAAARTKIPSPIEQQLALQAASVGIKGRAKLGFCDNQVPSCQSLLHLKSMHEARCLILRISAETCPMPGRSLGDVMEQERPILTIRATQFFITFGNLKLQLKKITSPAVSYAILRLEKKIIKTEIEQKRRLHCLQGSLSV
ncbi:uncharacterized protein [Aegilops tauschii subsp. strangulata]|uniref:uncharacterized protein isoform X2 n=1 Tax=Aegilops tauschii subsp. strangulata TaxID=200361 RepID=UPI001ABC19A9|nr:uncharacterized protein LOC120967868 [Aegilops tauschii subsp. strangulata]